ncbi:MAG TPA: hypothetical protein VF771_04175, partial [Longimicrobiaceae bacterium]
VIRTDILRRQIDRWIKRMGASAQTARQAAEALAANARRTGGATPVPPTPATAAGGGVTSKAQQHAQALAAIRAIEDPWERKRKFDEYYANTAATEMVE